MIAAINLKIFKDSTLIWIIFLQKAHIFIGDKPAYKDSENKELIVIFPILHLTNGSIRESHPENIWNYKWD